MALKLVDEETQLLGGAESPHSSPSGSRARTLLTGVSLATAFFVGAVMVKQPDFMAREETDFNGVADAKVDFETFKSGADQDGWYIYKVGSGLPHAPCLCWR